MKVGKRLSYRGKTGCQHPMCTRDPSHPEACFGWHCAHCDQSSSYQGHTKVVHGEVVFTCAPAEVVAE